MPIFYTSASFLLHIRLRRLPVPLPATPVMTVYFRALPGECNEAETAAPYKGDSISRQVRDAKSRGNFPKTGMEKPGRVFFWYAFCIFLQSTGNAFTIFVYPICKLFNLRKTAEQKDFPFTNQLKNG